jgi:hypothetical protein
VNEEQILERLRAIDDKQPAGLYLYALLDNAIYAGATMDGAGRSYGDLALVLADAKPESLFVYAFDDEHTDASPLLVSIRDLKGDLAKRIAALAMQYHLASWIWSPLPGSALARHFASFIRAKFGDTAAVLRPYDPRIMEETIACLDPAKQAALWEPVRAWAYLDESSEIKLLQRPEAQPAVKLSAPLVLDEKEQKRFEELANRIALGTYIETQAPSIMESLSAAERKAFCEQQIEIGERLRVYSMGELLIVAALSGAYGSQWIDDEAIRSMVESVISGKASLASVAPRMSDVLQQGSRFQR